jgi:hypothetical protein
VGTLLNPKIKEAVSFQPKGFGDVYWCNVTNFPVIISWKYDKSYCESCHQEILSDEEEEFKEHTFIAHIQDPWKIK